MSAKLSALMLSAALALAALAPAMADTPTAPPGPIPHGHKDAKLATTGDYKLDDQHVGVIAAVSHVGFSHSIFRFGKVEADLHWDPQAVGKSTLKVVVDTASIETNVPDFAKDISTNSLKSPAFPQATFVSTRFVQTDATHGKVSGDFTLMGKTVPVTFAVTLIGAGPFFGQERIGIHATTAINPKDFGLPDVFDEPIGLTVDTEFYKGEMKLG
jgi:polyisoprenoid-binding protein YceI